MHIQSAVKTDRGRVRQQNEDAFGLFPALHLYAVADGLGGHAGGEIASALAVDILGREIEESQDRNVSPTGMASAVQPPDGACLVAAVQQAHTQVLERSRREPALAGMGSTLAAVRLDGPEGLAHICHVGDSRVYRIRAGSIAQLTEDHSMGYQLLREGKLSPQELPTFRYRHVLTQALGASALVEPELQQEPLEAGDVFLLCTDGIYRDVQDQEMLAAVSASGTDLQPVCDTLVALANERGGRDDSTVLALRYVAGW